MKKIFKKLTYITLLGLLAVACSDDDDKEVKAVNISAKNAVQEVGNIAAINIKDNVETQLELFFMPQNTANKSVSYGTVNGGVFDVTQDGLIKPIVKTPTDPTTDYNVLLGIDTVVIKALDGSGAYVRYPVRIQSYYVKAESVTLSSEATSKALAPGEVFELAKYTNVNPANATNKTLKYSSSNESKLTIDPNTGVITALEVTDSPVAVTVSTIDGSKKFALLRLSIIAKQPEPETP